MTKKKLIKDCSALCSEGIRTFFNETWSALLCISYCQHSYLTPPDCSYSLITRCVSCWSKPCSYNHVFIQKLHLSCLCFCQKSLAMLVDLLISVGSPCSSLALPEPSSGSLHATHQVPSCCTAHCGAGQQSLGSKNCLRMLQIALVYKHCPSSSHASKWRCSMVEFLAAGVLWISSEG